MKNLDHYNFFSLYIKSEWNNLLSKILINDVEVVLRETAKNKYRELSEEEKNIKREYGRNRYHNMSEYGRNRYHNMSEESKQRLKEYQKKNMRIGNIFHRCEKPINIKRFI